jgi:hypothetical protein
MKNKGGVERMYSRTSFEVARKRFAAKSLCSRQHTSLSIASKKALSAPFLPLDWLGLSGVLHAELHDQMSFHFAQESHVLLLAYAYLADRYALT